MRRLGRLMAISVFCVCAQAGVAQAGFFDFLFNDNRPPPPSQNFSYDPAADARAAQARKVARLKYEAKKRAAIAAKAAGTDVSNVDARARALENIRRLSTIVATQGPQAAFLQDPTLRSGDIVVMRTGIAVFDGDGRSAHRPNQFRPLARSSLHGRSDLERLPSGVRTWRAGERAAFADDFGLERPREDG
jgi:hypothetical protein